jgi:hypothetical protein
MAKQRTPITHKSSNFDSQSRSQHPHDESINSGPGEPPSDLPLSPTIAPVQAQHCQQCLSIPRENNIVEYGPVQQDNEDWKLLPLGCSESLAFTEPNKSRQDMIQNSKTAECHWHERTPSTYTRPSLTKHFRNATAGELTRPHHPQLSGCPVEISFNSHTLRHHIAARPNSTESLQQEYLHELRSGINDDLLGIGAQFWSSDHTESREPFRSLN